MFEVEPAALPISSICRSVKLKDSFELLIPEIYFAIYLDDGTLNLLSFLSEFGKF
jgi:hypothetical protein